MLGTASACTGPLELSITTTMTSTVFDLAEDFSSYGCLFFWVSVLVPD